MSDVAQTDEMWSELHTLLQEMDVPPDRFSDINWLSRNLGIRNQYHANFARANQLVRNILMAIRVEIRKHPINQGLQSEQ